MEPLFFGEPGSGYQLGPWSRGHEFAFRHHDVGSFRARGWDRDDRLFHRHRFVTDFRFFQFAYPYDWYPEYDYGYPHDYSYYDYSPVFGNGYSSNLVMLVQSKLARRGYYDGPINGLIDSGSRRAIREFQTAEGLPITGQIDESFLRALGAGEFSTPPEDTSKIVPSPTPSTPAHDSPPVALWVKGKEGQQVLSPFTGGIVDVSGFPPGSEARCP
jgi:hypothetical protein